MLISARLVTVLGWVLLAGCGGSSQVKSPDERKNELRNTDCEWSPETTSRAFNRFAADGAVKDAMQRASSCGLNTAGSFDLSLDMSWGRRGCVAWVRLEPEVPSNVGECLLRRFETATVPPFGGVSPSVQVRMTNERASLTWR